MSGLKVALNQETPPYCAAPSKALRIDAFGAVDRWLFYPQAIRRRSVGLERRRDWLVAMPVAIGVIVAGGRPG